MGVGSLFSGGAYARNSGLLNGLLGNQDVDSVNNEYNYYKNLQQQRAHYTSKQGGFTGTSWDFMQIPREHDKIYKRFHRGIQRAIDGIEKAGEREIEII